MRKRRKPWGGLGGGLTGLDIQAGEVRNHLHGHLREPDLTVGHREGEVFMLLRQEFGARVKEHIAASG